jgi:hypothetical protein
LGSAARFADDERQQFLAKPQRRKENQSDGKRGLSWGPPRVSPTTKGNNFSQSRKGAKKTREKAFPVNKQSLQRSEEKPNSKGFFAPLRLCEKLFVFRAAKRQTNSREREENPSTLGFLCFFATLLLCGKRLTRGARGLPGCRGLPGVGRLPGALPVGRCRSCDGLLSRSIRRR